MRRIPKLWTRFLTAMGLLVLAWIWIWIPGSVIAAPSGDHELQTMADNTPDGGTLKLPEGSYQGPLVIRKAISVQGAGHVVITGDGSDSPVIRIEAARVSLRNVAVIQPSGGDNAAVLVAGNQAVLDALTIRTRSYGIVLRDSGQHDISGTTIDWEPVDASQPSDETSLKRNGIDLYNSHDNRIHDNRISRMNDGIYLESSHRNVVEHNSIDRSRYGVHCMYTDGTVVKDNYGEFNVTGGMVMGVRDALVTGNTFMKQSENVNSQGLLFFDVQTSRIANNKVEGNRVGLYIEQSDKNEFIDNVVVQNFVGIQFLESNQNRFTHNRLAGNVIQAEANESSDNRFERNYWDEFHGIDADGDGISDIAYAMNPFFQRLTSATPAFQLFFQSPGMQFLEGMYSSGKDEWTIDTAPLMNPAAEEQRQGDGRGGGTTGVLMLGLLFTLFSLTIITMMGVKRT
ncbi:Periplasmic copper-binding protein (NosD) [Paenibacillus konkukensis]|uniref:Periplasmic copper-binding protein (NosD) n=1 Tax=Paenibacillus konkukensis TaxID=2020716 RepID=A0ABY4RF43_9BACL|nr:NosD domain-containing protein [Paenibacillus konkukensis]UQZ81211.1 Periplasmic copper-binding protein (NosD) [Paenibacillus konkukensis]